MTPDPAGLASVDPSNPQTWNPRFASVANNPSNSIDPLALCGSGQRGDPPCQAPPQSITAPGDNDISRLDLAIEGGFNVTDAWLCSALGAAGESRPNIVH
jgi:hypothetical protein